MKIIRTITYEGTEEQLRKQMKHSLADGTYHLLTDITITSEIVDGGLRGQASKGWWKSEDEPPVQHEDNIPY